uniref:Uncharacterized protein n=1 Tax=Cacopsylla melanoneura TaxID=428564 RepID=A0A8D8RW88_9HEMI
MGILVQLVVARYALVVRDGGCVPVSVTGLVCFSVSVVMVVELLNHPARLFATSSMFSIISSNPLSPIVSKKLIIRSQFSLHCRFLSTRSLYIIKSSSTRLSTKCSGPLSLKFAKN